MIFRNKRPKIGLALGAGGAKGYSHIGVIKALEEQGIHIDYIAGSSIGSLIGGVYAATKDIYTVEQLALNTTKSTLTSILFDPSLNKGFCKGTKFTNFIRNAIGDCTFNDLKIPFAATATDLHTGTSVLLQEGNVAEAIQISCSLPPVFSPIERGDHLLTDGGISMPIPVSLVKKMGADIVIAVNLCQEYYDPDLSSNINITTIVLNSYTIMAHHLATEHVKEADIHIAPPLKHIGWKLLLTKEEKEKTIDLGYEHMKQNIPGLKLLIEDKKRSTFDRAFIAAKLFPSVVKQKKERLNNFIQNIRPLSFLQATSKTV